MKYEIILSKNSLYIKCLDKDLNTASVSRDSSYPMILKDIKTVIVDFDRIDSVDPTGLCWLIEFKNRLSAIGAGLFIKGNSRFHKAVEFLNLQNELPALGSVNSEQAI